MEKDTKAVSSPKFFIRKDSDRGAVSYSVAKVVTDGVTVTQQRDLGLTKEEAVRRADKYNNQKF